MKKTQMARDFPNRPREVCTPGKHICSIDEVAITRCASGCAFIAIACLEHGGLRYGEKMHNEHMNHIRWHRASLRPIEATSVREADNAGTAATKSEPKP